jgi:hypothetical protein
MDYDLHACLEYNETGISASDIEDVLAVWEGENDGADWRWVVKLTDGRFAFIQGWCDYTGWDCQSNAFATVHDSPQESAEQALTHDNEGFNADRDVRDALLSQLTQGKSQTWREQKDDELGVNSLEPFEGSIVIDRSDMELEEA